MSRAGPSYPNLQRQQEDAIMDDMLKALESLSETSQQIGKEVHSQTELATAITEDVETSLTQFEIVHKKMNELLGPRASTQCQWQIVFALAVLNVLGLMLLVLVD